MIGIILAGGYATRLKPLTDMTPKHLLPINGRPMLDYLYDSLATLPVKYALVTNSKFAHDFRAWVSDRIIPVAVIDDGTTTNEDRLGSIGDMICGLHEFAAQDIFIVGADNLTDFDFSAMLQLFERVKKPVIGVFDCGSLSEAAHMGVVEVDTVGKVISFVEKPVQPASTLVSTLFYMLPASCLSVMEKLVREGKGDKAGTLIEELLKTTDVYAYVHKGYWYDIGTRQSYAAAQEFMRNRH